MLCEITNTSAKAAELNKWHKIMIKDGIYQVEKYVEFKNAFDLNGNSLSCIPAQTTVYAEMSYNGNGYP